MFCPTCRAEYREGFNRCPDCDTTLVATLPPASPARATRFVELATFFNQGDIALIQARFDDIGLDYYFHGEQASRLVPLPLSARLMIRDDLADEAAAILRDMALL